MRTGPVSASVCSCLVQEGDNCGDDSQKSWTLILRAWAPLILVSLDCLHPAMHSHELCWGHGRSSCCLSMKMKAFAKNKVPGASF
uniref:Uncharacterized protein n=1 Tax=Mus musculus TaxID=10090 RepID=Q3UN06_MOUSE|nr:unnamed protein product [Mus musculus]